MAFFSTESEGESHLESIVFFLSEALRAAIETGDKLQQIAFHVPQFAPGEESSEIFEKLAAFRHYVGELWSLEVAIIAKILRARDLAKELRVHEPVLRPEIDTFRLATTMAVDLGDMLLPKKEAVFNGKVQPRSFLKARCQTGSDAQALKGRLVGYKIAGQYDVRLLLDACIALHFSLSTRYGYEAPAPTALPASEQAAYVAFPEEIGEEPFLLTDWEIISESPAGSPDRGRDISPASQAHTH